MTCYQRRKLGRTSQGSPLNVALHLPTLRTRKTACGSHHSSNTSSGLKTGAFELDAGGSKASVRMDELMSTRAGVTAESFGFGIKWNEYGRGSSLFSSVASLVSPYERVLTSPLSLFTSI